MQVADAQLVARRRAGEKVRRLAADRIESICRVDNLMQFAAAQGSGGAVAIAQASAGGNAVASRGGVASG